MPFQALPKPAPKLTALKFRPALRDLRSATSVSLSTEHHAECVGATKGVADAELWGANQPARVHPHASVQATAAPPDHWAKGGERPDIRTDEVAASA
eukprot:8150520-Alexandrium_andersonii.AAC.1